MRSIRLIYLMTGVAFLVTAQSARAGEPANARQGREAGRANPYSRLFHTPAIKATPQGQSASSSSATAPKMVCGMTMIPADPSIDPGIFAGPRRSDTHYTMRIVPQPMCK